MSTANVDAELSSTAEVSTELVSPFPSFEPAAPSKTETPVTETAPARTAPARPTPEVTTTTKPSATPASTRDMTGIPSEYHDDLKQMSLSAFNRIKPLLVDVAEGKLVKSDTIQEKIEAAQLEQHPRGFVISKEFEELTTEHAAQVTLKETLTTALLNVKTGKPFTLEVERNGKMVKEKFAASPKNELLLQDMYQKASAKEAQYEAQLEEMEKNHATKHSARAKDVESFDQTLFSEYQDKPGFKEKLALIDGDKSIPKSLRNSVHFGLIKKLLALNLTSMEALHNVSLKNNERSTEAGATPSSVHSGGLSIGKEIEALSRNRELFGMAAAVD